MSDEVRRHWLADLALIGITIIWGSSFVLVKLALRQASPLLLNAARMSLAGLLLVAWYRGALRRLPAAVWGAGALLGLSMSLGFAFQTRGLLYTTPARSAFLTGFSVILVPFLGAAWRRRWPTARVFSGALLALAGLYLLVLPSWRWGSGLNHGDLLTLVSALFFAAQIQLLEVFCLRHDFRQLSVLQVAYSAIFFAAVTPWLETPRWHAGLRLWGLIAALAVLATAMAFTLQAWAQQYASANHTAIVLTLEPVWAWLASAWWLHAGLSGRQALGALCILTAMVMTGWHDHAAHSEPPAALEQSSRPQQTSDQGSATTGL